MAATKQSQAIALANDVLGAAQQTMALLDQINGIVSRYNKISPSTTWSAMATAPVIADGSLGASDGTPVAANPINPGAAGLSGLARAVKASDLVTAISNLEGLQAWLTNQNANGSLTQADREAVFRPLIGG